MRPSAVDLIALAIDTGTWVSWDITAHRAAGLRHLVYLRRPTTGGVFASWGSLGHTTAAEPGALIGFLGPRVHDALTARAVPAGVQTAENLHRHGLIDAVVVPEQVAALTQRALAVLCTPWRIPRPAEPTGEADSDPAAWDVAQRSWRSDRPSIRRLLRHAARDVVPLHGTHSGQTGTG